eukprot:GHVL01018476.1.p1 GENE.GHVL01018476.1~~GHVL01018476.1.p1  ORF type:complete len:458 (-),score=83.81 GHVL01018476.1:739-2112(-)
MKEWSVHKFGGTSVGGSDRLSNIATILDIQLKKEEGKIAVVVSAMCGVTNSLSDACDSAERVFLEKSIQNKNDYNKSLQEVKQKHTTILEELLKIGKLSKIENIINNIEKDVQKIICMLEMAELCGNISEIHRDFILSHGELWSSVILNDILNEMGLNSVWLDSRKILVVKKQTTQSVHFTKVQLNFPLSQRKFDHVLEQLDVNTQLIVLPGFIASFPDGIPTTLKRNGSDYSAALMSFLLPKCPLLTIWTDVDGIYTADPRLVSDAFRLTYLTYEEALEMTYFGAKVLHPLTMGPCIRKQIPINLRSSFNPESPGTLIASESYLRSKFDLNKDVYSCKGFGVVKNIALVTFIGNSMVAVSGIVSRIFNALRNAEVSVMFISQASSEHSITFAVADTEVMTAKAAVSDAFFKEIEHEKSMSIEVELHCAIVCAVGKNMAGRKGILGELAMAFAKGVY